VQLDKRTATGKKGSALPIILGVLFILAAVGLMLSYADSIRIATVEIPDWIETTAIIKDAWVTGVEIDSFQKDSPYDYRVVFGYILTFTTDAGAVTFENKFSNTGRTNSTTTVPDSAYEIFKPGEAVTITYDPHNPESYHFGTKADVTAGFRSAAPLIFVGIFGLLGVLSLVFGFRKAVGGAV